MCSGVFFLFATHDKMLSLQYFTEANEADSWMNDKAGLAANQDYGKDELSAEKLLTRHAALQTAVDTYSPTIQNLAEQARKLVQTGHFAASKITSRQVQFSRMIFYLFIVQQSPYFASTTHSETHRDYIGRVGQSSHSADYSVSTDVTKIRKPSPPKPDTKTPKNQGVEKVRERVPPNTEGSGAILGVLEYPN